MSSDPTRLFAAIINLSAANFVAPYKFIGLTALSVDKAIVFLTLFLIAASTIFWAPRIFVLTNSKGLYSAVSTCFNAAACTIISTPFVAKISLSSSLISPIKKRTFL